MQLISIVEEIARKEANKVAMVIGTNALMLKIYFALVAV